MRDFLSLHPADAFGIAHNVWKRCRIPRAVPAPTVTAALLILLFVSPRPVFAWNWKHAGVDSSSGITGQYVSMTVDLNGRLHAAYYRHDSFSEGNRNLKYATNYSPTGNGPWQTTFVDGGASVGSYSSIALTSTGVPHIAYYESEFQNLRHAWYDSASATWMKETVDSPGTVGQYSAMGVDTLTNTLYIAYFDASQPGLKVARKAPGELWTFSFADHGVTGLYNSMCTTPTVQIAYYDLTGRNLKFAERAGTTWNTVTVDSIGDVGRQASIAAFGNYVWIAYQDFTNDRLKFAERYAGVWTVTTLDPGSSAGGGTAMSVGPGGRPAIIYYATASQDLRYAERFNGTWLYSTVATGGNVGRFSSLSMGSDNLPNSLYLDESQGKLRFSHGFGATTGVPDEPDEVVISPFALRPRVSPTGVPAIIDLVAQTAGPISLRLFDITGRAVREIYDGPAEAGSREFYWNGTDDIGRPVASGIYFGVLQSQRGNATTRIVLIR